jgi:hypothetical protein
MDNDSFSTLRQPRHLADGKDLVGASRRQKHAERNNDTITIDSSFVFRRCNVRPSEINLSAEALILA